MRVERKAVALADCSSQVQKLADAEGFRDLNPAQRVVAALNWLVVSEYARCMREALLKRALILPGVFLLATACGFGIVFAAGSLAEFCGMSVPHTCYGVSAVAVTFAIILRWRAGARRIVVSRARQKLEGQRRKTSLVIDSVRIGRLDSIFRPRRLQTGIGLLGLLFGLEVGVINAANEHLGFGDRDTIGDQTLIAIDNICYGALLDTFELYGISVTQPVEHTTASATVFLVFRTASDVLILFLIFVLIQRRRFKGIVARFPIRVEPGTEELVHWIDRLLIDKAGWMRRFPDEMLYLLLVQKFLEGKPMTMRQIAFDWPRLRLTPEVRMLFVDDNGNCILDQPLEVD